MRREAVDDRFLGFWSVRDGGGDLVPRVIRIYPDDRSSEEVLADLHFWMPGQDGPHSRTSDVGVVELTIGDLVDSNLRLNGIIHKTNGEKREFRLDGQLVGDGTIRATLTEHDVQRSVVLAREDTSFTIPIRVITNDAA